MQLLQKEDSTCYKSRVCLWAGAVSELFPYVSESDLSQVAPGKCQPFLDWWWLCQKPEFGAHQFSILPTVYFVQCSVYGGRKGSLEKRQKSMCPHQTAF